MRYKAKKKKKNKLIYQSMMEKWRKHDIIVYCLALYDILKGKKN